MKLNKTVIAVIAGIAIILAAAYAEYSFSDPYIDIGRTFENSTLTVGAAGYRFNKKWDLAVRSIGQGDTRRGPQEQQFILVGKRVFYPRWFFLDGEIRPGIGIAHTPNLTLVGKTNYNLAVEWSWKLAFFRYEHLSSAGQFPINTGVDYVTFGLWLR